MRFMLLPLFLICFISQSLGQTIPQGVGGSLAAWKTLVQNINVESLEISYRQGKVVEQMQTNCLNFLSATQIDLSLLKKEQSLANAFAFSSDFQAASDCLGTLSDEFNNPAIAGDSQFSIALAQKFTDAYSESNRQALEILKWALSRADRADAALKKCGKD